MDGHVSPSPSASADAGPSRSGRHVVGWALAVASASVAVIALGLLGPWEVGRLDVSRPGTRGATGGLEDGGWILAVLTLLAAAVLAVSWLTSRRWLARAALVLALLVGGAVGLAVIGELSFGSVGCDAWFVPVCEAGEDFITRPGWGAKLAGLGSLGLMVGCVLALIVPTHPVTPARAGRDREAGDVGVSP